MNHILLGLQIVGGMTLTGVFIVGLGAIFQIINEVFR